MSETEIDQALKQPGQQQSPEMNLLTRASRRPPRPYLRAELGAAKVIEKWGGTQSQAAAAKWNEEYNAVKPVFSPRYGTFEAGTRGFVDAGRFGTPAQPPQQQRRHSKQQQQ